MVAFSISTCLIRLSPTKKEETPKLASFNRSSFSENPDSEIIVLFEQILGIRSTVVDIFVSNVLCYGGNSGYISMIADTNTGFPTYNFEVNSNSINQTTSDTAFSLTADTFTVNIIDSIGCLSDDTIL